jgi:hypothetical protein
MNYNTSTANYLARLEHSPTPDYHWIQSPALRPQEALKLIEQGQGCVLHSGYDYLDDFPPDLTPPSFDTPPSFNRPPSPHGQPVTLPSIHVLLNNMPPKEPLTHGADVLKHPVPGRLTLRPVNAVIKKRAPRPDARELIAQSASKEQNKENLDPATGKKERGAKKYSGSDLIQLARAVVDKAPFLEPYRHKTAGWKEVKEHLEENGFRHIVGHDLIRQKAIALVAYRKVCLNGLSLVGTLTINSIRTQKARMKRSKPLRRSSMEPQTSSQSQPFSIEWRPIGIAPRMLTKIRRRI